MDTHVRRIWLGLLIALPVGLLSACYPFGRMPAYTGSYPYNAPPMHPGQPGQPGGQPGPQPERHAPWQVVSEESVTTVDGSDVTCNWKERMAQPYVYLTHQGDYRGVHDVIRNILKLGVGMEISGPPFVLYFDDPARTPADELLARVCLPVQVRPKRLPEQMGYEVLPRSMVVYAEVPGAYDQTGRSYGALFQYMRKLNWEKAGALREIYLVNPAAVSSPDELLAEVQLPVQVR